MHTGTVILFISAAYFSHALTPKKQAAQSVDSEKEFDDFVKNSCFTAMKGAAMDAQSKFMLTPADSAHDCLQRCVNHGETKKPPVCCLAANFFAEKQVNAAKSEKYDFLKSGVCECFYTISYAAYSKRKSAIWFKRSDSVECLNDSKCPNTVRDFQANEKQHRRKRWLLTRAIEFQ